MDGACVYGWGREARDSAELGTRAGRARSQRSPRPALQPFTAPRRARLGAYCVLGRSETPSTEAPPHNSPLQFFEHTLNAYCEQGTARRSVGVQREPDSAPI